MSLLKYQGHDETTQVSYTTSLYIGVWIALTGWVGYLSCFQIFQLFTRCFLYIEVFLYEFLFSLLKVKNRKKI